MDHEVKEISVPDPAAPSGYLTKYRVMRGRDRVATCHRRSLAERVVAALDRPQVARNLYRVDVGATYSVTAVSPAEALGLVALAADGNGPPDPDAERVSGDVDADDLTDLTDGFTIEALSEESAGTFWDEQRREKRSLWQAHWDAERSEVIACSEWP